MVFGPGLVGGFEGAVSAVGAGWPGGTVVFGPGLIGWFGGAVSTVGPVGYGETVVLWPALVGGFGGAVSAVGADGSVLLRPTLVARFGGGAAFCSGTEVGGRAVEPESGGREDVVTGAVTDGNNVGGNLKVEWAFDGVKAR